MIILPKITIYTPPQTQSTCIIGSISNDLLKSFNAPLFNVNYNNKGKTINDEKKRETLDLYGIGKRSFGAYFWRYYLLLLEYASYFYKQFYS